MSEAGSGIVTAPTTKPSGSGPHSATRQRSSSKWSKTIVNFWLDSLLLVLFLGLVWVSAILRFLVPVGPTEAAWRLWGGDVLFWREAQFVLLCLFALGVLVHVMLHWSWVCGVVTKHLLGRPPSRDDGTQTLIGVGVMLAILHLLGAGLLLAWFFMQQRAV